MFHIGIDIGGTFTDCVLIGADTHGRVTTYRTAKALSTPGDPADGVMAGLAELGRQRRPSPCRNCWARPSGSGTGPRSAPTRCWNGPAPESG
jgi:N-methylhydantoinase A/oxoprolinase/acetone carboxylase beta subunit